MNKLILSVILALIGITSNAQFAGGFDCADPDAWFDKEIYFYCQNNANNGYYGLNLSNVSLIVDNQYQVDVDGLWYYGSFLFLSKDTGFEFSKGSTVALWVNGYHQGTWICPTSNPTAVDIVKHAWSKKPHGRLGIKGKDVIKILRKIRL